MRPLFSTSTPDGTDTIHGYFAREHPEAFDLLGDPINDLAIDVLIIQAQAAERGVHCEVVEAPVALRERGITNTIAYPIDFLTKQLT